MRRRLSLMVLALGLVLSSCGGDNPPSHKLDHLSLTGNYQTEFVVGTEFNCKGLGVNAIYDDGASISVSDFNVIDPEMNVVGYQDVTVQYLSLSTTYQINIIAETLTGISLSGTYVTSFTIGDTFSSAGLIVTAAYNSGKTATIRDYQISSPDMTILGEQKVTVSYGGFNVSYNISVKEEESAFPLSQLTSFLSSRGVETPASYLTSKILEIEKVSSYEVVEDDDCPYFIVSFDMGESYLDEIDEELNLSGWEYFDGDTLVDPDKNIGVEFYYLDNECYINFFVYSDLVEVPPEKGEVIEKTDDFLLYEIICNDPNAKKNKSDLTKISPYTVLGHEDFKFSFSKGTGTNVPISTNEGSKDSVIIYTGNTFEVETVSDTYLMSKIEFSSKSGYENILITSDIGSVDYSGDKVIWTGSSSAVNFSSPNKQYRFDNVHIEYTIPKVEPIPEGIKTISEIYDIAESLIFTGTDGYLVNNDVTIEVCLKAIDAIDSVTTSGGLPSQARGKVLCADDTGYIVCSSGVNKSNPIDFYQRVKDYIKEGTTTYYVKGHLAKLNDVLEINVSEYQYRSDLSFSYDLNDFVTSGVTDSDSFMNHCKNIFTNKDGYGLGKIVKLSALTYFNKYNSAGSYYFLDQLGKLVPIYSLLDKDRKSLEEGKVYDIIGVESLYKGRPSLRILKVTPNLGADPASFDFTNAVEKQASKYFYNVNSSNPSYKEEFYNSVTTIYKMDAYISRYAADKYTFNDSYYKYDKEFTTGNSQVSAAQHYSLGVFNENLDYKQIFLDFILENASSEEECVSITIYFTLAYLDTVDGKKMWRVNIFEDLVFGLDYYESESKTIDFTSLIPNHDESKQWYISNGLTVTNASTSLNNYSYSTYYLKVVDGTSLEIEFNKPIIAFTIYHKTYSYIAGIGELAIASYRQFKDHTVFLLTEATTKIYIDDFSVGASRNNGYLGIESIVINY